jgi:hypothetical protein
MRTEFISDQEKIQRNSAGAQPKRNREPNLKAAANQAKTKGYPIQWLRQADSSTVAKRPETFGQSALKAEADTVQMLRCNKVFIAKLGINLRFFRNFATKT